MIIICQSMTICMVGFARPPVCLHLCHYLFSPVCLFVYLLHLLCLSVDLFHVYLYVSFLSFKHAICLGLPLNLCNSHTVNKLFPIRLLFISPCHRSQMPINGWNRHRCLTFIIIFCRRRSGSGRSSAIAGDACDDRALPPSNSQPKDMADAFQVSHRARRCRNPPDERDLKDQADDAGNWSTDGEEGEPGQ